VQLQASEGGGDVPVSHGQAAESTGITIMDHIVILTGRCRFPNSVAVHYPLSKSKFQIQFFQAVPEGRPKQVTPGIQAAILASHLKKGTRYHQRSVQQTKNASIKVDQLGDAANAISKVTEVITEISEQTNLLVGQFKV
jgi:hypothetical protein